MIALGIVLAVIILFALLRFGASVVYNADGFAVSARVGFLSLRIYPREEKPRKAAKKAAKRAKKLDKKKEKKKKKPDEEITDGEKKPGKLKDYLEMLPAIKKVLGRLRRRLLIKTLIVHLIIAGDDPSKTAMIFGAANAGIGVMVPALEKFFRIRRRDFRTSADFDRAEPYIYIKAAISLAVWEAIYIVFAIIPVLVKGKATQNTSIDGKDEKKNGQAPDQ